MKVQSITTDFSRNMLWHTEEIDTGTADCMHQICLYPEYRRQTVEGFGGAFTDAAAQCWKRLPVKKQAELMEAYFGETGLRYSIGRTHMGSCDFATENYAALQNAEDAQPDFSRDDEALLPMIHAAQAVAGCKLPLLLSPWSPPAFMKTNGDMNHGGKLKKEFEGRWAELMAAYAAHYQVNGCTVRWMSVQNEPEAVQTWDSCIYTAQEEGRFAADQLKPALMRAGVGDIAILAWDHNKEALLRRAEGSLSVPGADAAVQGFALHWYTGDHFEALRLFGERWPSKSLVFTEGCVEYSRFDGMSPLRKAEMYAHDLIGNLSCGVSASIDWNLVLDAKGGPNHVGNFCEAPVMLLEDASDFARMTEYYYIGQLSRYVRPGDVCIGTSSYTSGLENVAFLRADGTLTVIVLNGGDEDRAVSIAAEEGCSVNTVIGKHSIRTFVFRA